MLQDEVTLINVFHEVPWTFLSTNWSALLYVPDHPGRVNMDCISVEILHYRKKEAWSGQAPPLVMVWVKQENWQAGTWLGGGEELGGRVSKEGSKMLDI